MSPIVLLKRIRPADVLGEGYFFRCQNWMRRFFVIWVANHWVLPPYFELFVCAT